MKCRFLSAVRILNPAWSQAAANAATDAGTVYDVSQTLEFAPGYVVEDPQAWIHCCPGEMNAPPIAEPADEQCAAAVREWMEKQRPAGIAQLKAQLDQIDLLQNPADKQRLLDLGRAYGLIATKTPAAASPKRATPAATDSAN
jgi:hypothetical protein